MYPAGYHNISTWVFNDQMIISGLTCPGLTVFFSHPLPAPLLILQIHSFQIFSMSGIVRSFRISSQNFLTPHILSFSKHCCFSPQNIGGHGGALIRSPFEEHGDRQPLAATLFYPSAHSDPRLSQWGLSSRGGGTGTDSSKVHLLLGASHVPCQGQCPRRPVP